MARYRIDSMGDLARQMTFTPQDVRLAQISAAEDLLHDIDPAKAYPIDFVVFRITGYHPKDVAADLLTGLALQHDLGLLIEQLSDSLDIRARSLAEPVLTIDDVTEKFNVTSKTIQRWRRRGLPARRFLFTDGKRRVGFLLSSVERFFATHRDQVSRGTNFSQVTDSERDEILRRAQRLAVYCQCCVHEISRRIARHMNRSPLTIQHIIRKHDQENPDRAIFAKAPAPISDAQRQRILRAYRCGLAIGSLSRRICRPKSAIYRVVMGERIEKLNRRKIRYIDDPLYHEPDARRAIETIASQEDLTSSVGKPEEVRIPRDLPPYLQDLYRTPLLSAKRERALFLKFNFHKFEFVQSRRALEPEFARSRDLDAMEHHLRDAIDTKNQIVRANLRLVVSVARKHLRVGLSLMELVSDGNMTLMRAVESFDIHKGNRFSTYATLALMKGFARSVPLMLSSGKQTHRVEYLSDLPDLRGQGESDRISQRDELRELLSQLEERERVVLLARFGLCDEDSPATFEQVGQRLGLSKQRVRQIEQTAIAKLRAVAAK
jgi:RNA polymerase sigma factor (sigma-70 family)